jgi:hypothetical protein
MTRIVVVHGIGQQYLGPRTIQRSVAAAVADGVALAGGPPVTEDDVTVAFYGDWFRPPGRKGAGYELTRDELDRYERAMLSALWAGAARVEPDRVPNPSAGTSKIPTPVTAQRALDAMSHSRSLAGVADHFLLGTLRQVRRYLTEEETRERAQERIAACMGPRTEVVIGHSLGSIVAYEALCANTCWPVKVLVTLGSPLGIRNLIFDRLQPPPVGGHGHWPGSLRSWTNVCDRYDVVALVKELAPLFGAGVNDVCVSNGWRVHDLVAHLTAVETGRAVTAGLVA